MTANAAAPRILVFSSLFPHSGAPAAGVFIKERMFRVAEHIPVVVVSPQPWFPFQSLIRQWKPFYRLPAPIFDKIEGVDVYHPRFLCIPGVFKHFDGHFMAIFSYWTLFKLKSRFPFNIIDAHFAYPDGFAATLLGRWFHVPVSITLRGTEVPLSRFPRRRNRIVAALASASRVFSVAASLKSHVVSLGADEDKIKVIGNGVDAERFCPLDKETVRDELGIKANCKVAITVGGLIERKGFHRVIELLPTLKKRYPDLIYLIVGEGGPEGDIEEQLKSRVKALQLQGAVRFLGALRPEQLKTALSAADIFVLATANEGWANVLLEAMACGLPVVATDVGGNKEVINRPELGSVVPFGDESALLEAVSEALATDWDRRYIRNFAEDNSWNSRVTLLRQEFDQLLNKTNTA